MKKIFHLGCRREMEDANVVELLPQDVPVKLFLFFKKLAAKSSSMFISYLLLS